MTIRLAPFAAALAAIASNVHADAAESSTSADRLVLPPVTVIGVRGEPDRIAGSAHVVDQQRLEEFRYDDLNRVLNFVPGVYVREEDGYGLRPNIGLRGAGTDRSAKVTLLEDGVLFGPAPYSAPAAYYFPLTARMVGVEVFKGPASIQHGPQTVGGAINLVSAPIPDETEALVNVAGGSNLYHRAHLRGGTQVGDVGVMGEFVHVGTDGFKQLDGGGNTGFLKNEFLTKAAWRIGPGVLQVRAGYADESSNETYLGLTEGDFRATPDRRYGASALDNMDNTWFGGRIGWQQPLLGGNLQVTAYGHSFQRAWRKFNDFSGADIREVLSNPDTPLNQLFVASLQGADTDGVAGSPDDILIGTNDRSFRLGGVQAVTDWSIGERVSHLLQAGVRLHHDQIERVHDEFAFEQIGGELLLNSVPRAILTNNRVSTEAIAVWFRDEIQVGNWTIVPGVRVESIFSRFRDRASGNVRDNSYTVVLPGLGTSYELLPGLRVLAGVHRGFAPAAPAVANDNRPEKSINYEAGGRWSSSAGRFELIGFFNDYSNLTAICTVSSGCSPTDVDTQTSAGAVEAYGVEAGWNHAFAPVPGLRLPVAMTYTWTQAEFKEDFVSTDPQFGVVEAGFELPYVPEHRLNTTAGIAGRRWGVDVSATYLSSMRDQAGRGAIAPGEGSDAYAVFDLAGRVDLLAQLTVNARVDNLLDRRYVVSRRPFGARPGLPRVFQIGMVYRY